MVASPKVTTTIRLPKALYKRLKIQAIKEERPLQEVVADACADFMAQTMLRKRS